MPVETNSKLYVIEWIPAKNILGCSRKYPYTPIDDNGNPVRNAQ